MTDHKHKIIISCQESSYDLSLRELFQLNKNFKLVKWLVKGVAIVESELNFAESAKIIRNSNPIFLRHIFPMDYALTDFKGNSNDLEPIISHIINRMDKKKKFSVQARVLKWDGSIFNKHEIMHLFADPLMDQGFLLDVEQPDQIISVVTDSSDWYIGLSSVWENLSSWPGAMRRYQKKEDQISRAESKLLEALELFEIDLSSTKQALDLGASPGGWTNVLIQQGLSVTAVDPAELNDQLLKHKNVHYFKGSAQEYLKNHNNQFDLIVNDMKMDVMLSCEIMLDAYNHLKDGGMILMTFKLPKMKQFAYIKSGIQILQKKYQVIHRKQLFHNRSEITVCALK